VGRAAITFRTTGVLDAEGPAARIAGAEFHERHFLRVSADDRPGALARITGILGEHRISIASVIQHEPSGAAGAAVPLVIMTHRCGSEAIRKAVAHIDASDVVAGRSVCLSVLDDESRPAAS
jgi:homoserine dehydrogenase